VRQDGELESTLQLRAKFDGNFRATVKIYSKKRNIKFIGLLFVSIMYMPWTNRRKFYNRDPSAKQLKNR